eukprot:5643045-Prymnesium_polylepis.1
MRDPVGAEHRSNAGPRCAPGIGQCDVGRFNGCYRRVRKPGPRTVGPALRRCTTMPWSVGPLHPP